MAYPVITSWGTPDSFQSIRSASAPSFGFPMISPSQTTTVSAPMKNLPSTLAATFCAFSRASLTTWSSGSSPGRTSSGTSPGCTSNSTPADASSSTRRGDAEARTTLPALVIFLLPLFLFILQPSHFHVDLLNTLLFLPVPFPVLLLDEIENHRPANDH